MKKSKIYYEKARDCVNKLLMLLEKYNISATWAVVGHLFLNESNSSKAQEYINISKSIYPWYSKDWIEEAHLWHGQDIINKIMNCKVHQEIGSHSFTHIIYGSRNTERAVVHEDLANCVSEAEKFGLKLKSFVFPRNNAGYIDELRSFGFEAYRGAEPSWYSKFPSKLRKVCHIIDQFLAISPPVSMPEYDQGLLNIPASMFYRPMDGIRNLIPIKLKIIKAKKGIRKAIRYNRVFHMWFHPFNIATNQDKLLYGLEEIFKEINASRECGGLETKSMGEITHSILSS